MNAIPSLLEDEQCMGASASQTGLSQAEPDSLGPSGFDPSRVRVFQKTVWIDETASKCGIRFLRLSSREPYEHQFWVDVTGDEGREDDDSLTEDLFPFYGREFVAVFREGEYGLEAKPSDFTIASAIEAFGQDAKRLDAEHESAVPQGDAQ